jgi:hypothetical protein
MAMRMSRVLIPLLVALPALASAKKKSDDGTHFGVRLGSGSLQLAAGSDTPVLGSYFDRATEAYGAAATAYNRQHGAGSAPAMDISDMDLGAALLLVTPQLEVGSGVYFMRLEVPLGFSDAVNMYGFGVYPLGLQFPLGGSGAKAFVTVGGTASYASAQSAQGALLVGRTAVGVKFASDSHYALTVELGYGLYAVGGVIDFERLEGIEDYDPRGMAPPPTPDSIAQGGKQNGMIDFSVGFALP